MQQTGHQAGRGLALAIRLAWAVGVVLVLLTGCAVGPNYARPAVATPEHFRFDPAESTNLLGQIPWLAVFKDPALQELIRSAIVNNYDLKQAAARVEQARNFAVGARSPFFPQIGYGGDVGRGRNTVFNVPAPNGGVTESSAQVNLNATWEIDFWGRIRRLSESARAQYLATEEARRGVTITLVGDVAIAYVQLLQYDRELAIQRAATNAYANSYRIFDDRLRIGSASKLETARAAAALANASSLIPQLELNVATTENQLSVLLGRSPGPISRGSLGGGPLMPGESLAGLPSELLQRRPDVLAAEQKLIAANADIGANLANFFPKIGLTTLVGNVSPELSAFTAGSASAWNVGATMTGPLFEGGLLRARYRAAKSKFEEARAAYQQSVLMACLEVSNALILRQKMSEVRDFQAAAALALESSVSLATERYLNGRAGYYEVLQTQQELYPAQRAQVEAQASEFIAVIQLYRALGGGWQTNATAAVSK